MKYISVGDLASSYQLRNHNTQLKSTLADLTHEVMTGIKSDTGAAVRGDFRALASINGSLARLEIYGQTGTKAGLVLSTMQSSLDHIRSTASDVAKALMSSGSGTTSTGLPTSLSQATSALTSVLSSLNVSASGHHVFSGIAVDTVSVRSAEDLMSSLAAATAGLTQADDIAEAVTQWFDAAPGGGGYLDTMFGGSQTGVSGIALSEETSITIPVTAADPAIRDVIKGLALAALAADAGSTLPDSQRQSLANLSAGALLASDSGLIETQAQLGGLESLVETAETRNGAEKTTLSTARLDLIGADSYETSTALKAAQSQLEILYTLTARLSDLSLANYL